MTPRERLHRLDAVAARLPFHAEDYDAANHAFEHWAATADDAALHVVELWAYCYTQRYVLVRFALHPARATPADVDQLVSATFLQVREHLADVHDPARFTHWVSVVCRNAYVNFLRRPRVFVAGVEPEHAPEPAAADAPLGLDGVRVERAVRAALARLPEGLRQVARLRFFEGRSYDHIAAATGHPVPTARAYAAKAAARLREDAALRALYAEVVGAPSGGGRRAAVPAGADDAGADDPVDAA